jgi:LysR family transcriptional regulator, hca operon transcriptional activator
VFPLVEIRHLNAVVVLAEERNFTKAAQRLHITQAALSKQITDLEAQYDIQLFLREKGRVLDLTAGRAFVVDARVAVFRAERAVHSARAASEGYDRVLIVGHSSHANQAWLSSILAIRLPSYPRLKIRFATRFGTELVRGVLTGELNLALVTAPAPDPTITAVPFASAPVYAALPLDHPGAHKKRAVPARSLNR